MNKPRMRQLILVRHARARDAEPGQQDRDRPLHRSGREQCRFLEEWLRSHVAADAEVFTSPAVRARQTASEILDDWFEGPVHVDERLWAATPARLMQVVAETRGNLVLIAHNPGLESLQRVLTGHLLPIPTAGAIELEYIDRYTSRRRSSFQPPMDST